LKNEQPWFDKRLNQYDRIILVTQGTVERDVEKIIVPTLEAFKNTDVLVLATTGGSETENLRKRFPHKNIIIEDFIPFGDVMPYADVYVSNGGYGGVLLAIEHELPCVVAGIHEGKSEICARVGYFSLGINLRTETPQRMQLRRSVEEVMNDQKYKINVIRLAREFTKYDPNKLTANYINETLTAAEVSRKEEVVY
jgi:UDP:flavonoid glycosyltransferase YjiC (YdhE family)